MTLGERIYRYRTERGLSQLEVAEKLDVSRQSVSKWETDGAVPDLDKLVKLSKLFGVTMDELVKGEGPAAPEGENAPAMETSTPPIPQAPQQAPSRDLARIVAGGVLLAVGLLAMLVLFIVRYDAALLALPVVVVGVILLTVRRGAGLICGWLVFGVAVIFLHWAVIGAGYFFFAPYWLVALVLNLFRGEEVGQLFWNCVASVPVFVLFVVLVVVTARRICRAVKERR